LNIPDIQLKRFIVFREQIQCLKSRKENEITRLVIIGDSRMRYLHEKFSRDLVQNIADKDFEIDFFAALYLDQFTFDVTI
jgi:hypothetical protein